MNARTPPRRVVARRAGASSASAGPRDLAGPIAVTVAGLVLTLVVAGVLAARDRTVRRHAFESAAADAVAELDLLFAIPVELAHAVGGLFSSSDEVTATEFRSFVAPILDRHAEIHTFEWVVTIPAGARDSLEAVLRSEGHAPDGLFEQGPDGFREAGVRDHHAVIRFLEPVADHVIGWDVGYDPDGDSELQHAATIGEAVATGGFRLREDPDAGTCVLTYVPVARRTGHDRPPSSSPPELGAVGATAYEGFLAVLLLVDEVITNAPSLRSGSKLAIRLVDLDADDGEGLLHRMPGHVDDAALHASGRFGFADRTWRVDVAPAAPSAWAASTIPRWVLLAGVILSLVSGWAIRARARLQALGREMEAVREIGQYRMGRKLGEGGMGVVFEAEHALLARRAAIKLVRDDALADAATYDRFEREARITAGLRSPHTVQVYDFGRSDDGEIYYVMELLDGVDLDTLVRTHGPLEPGRVLHVLHQACHSLAEAHARGLVHRDVKPANLALCRQGLDVDVVKVLDFGLARRIPGTEPLGEGTLPGATLAGEVIGTPAFFAPELAKGAAVDGRADLYALGCVGYWLLTGAWVFPEAPPMQMIADHVATTPEPPSRRTEIPIPPDLEAVILRCLAKSPGDRFADASRLDEALRACADFGGWTEARARAWWQRHPDGR